MWLGCQEFRMDAPRWPFRPKLRQPLEHASCSKSEPSHESYQLSLPPQASSAGRAGLSAQHRASCRYPDPLEPSAPHVDSSVQENTVPPCYLPSSGRAVPQGPHHRLLHGRISTMRVSRTFSPRVGLAFGIRDPQERQVHAAATSGCRTYTPSTSPEGCRHSGGIRPCVAGIRRVSPSSGPPTIRSTSTGRGIKDGTH